MAQAKRSMIISTEQLMGGMSVWILQDEVPIQGFVCGKRTGSHALILFPADQDEPGSRGLLTTSVPARLVFGRPEWVPLATEFRNLPMWKWGQHRVHFSLNQGEGFDPDALAEIMMPTPRKGRTRGGSPRLEPEPPRPGLVVSEPLSTIFGNRPMHIPIGLPAPFETRGASPEMGPALGYESYEEPILMSPSRLASRAEASEETTSVAKLIQMFEEQQQTMRQLQAEIAAVRASPRDDEDWWGTRPKPTAQDDVRHSWTQKTRADADAIESAQRLLAKHGMQKMPPKMPPCKEKGAAPLWDGPETFDLASPAPLDDDDPVGGGRRYGTYDEDGELGARGPRANATVCALKNMERARAQAPSLGRQHWSDLVRRLHAKVPAHGTLKMQLTHYFTTQTNVRRHRLLTHQLTPLLEMVDALETNDQDKMLHAVAAALRFVDQFAFEDGKYTTAHRISLLPTPCVPYERDAKKRPPPPDTVFAPLVSEDLMGLATGAGKALSQVSKDVKEQD
jgi:hypothetical protein